MATVPSGRSRLLNERALSLYCGTAVRVFDPFAPDTAPEFADFLETVPMRNDRPMPARAIAETRSALAGLCAAMQCPEPTYFVATNLEKSVFAPQPARKRHALAARYGEALYPQVVAPVFASHAGAGVPAMLSAATGLAPAFFADSPGSRDGYHRLFLLTEASHCGFLARYRGDEDGPDSFDSVDSLRAVIEALGDYEGIAAFRCLQPDGDEASVLEAARIAAMFLRERPSAYTCIPALTIAFDEYGIDEGIRRLPGILREVAEARSRFRDVLSGFHAGRPGPVQLTNLASALQTALAADLSCDPACSSFQYDLLSRFPAAAAILAGGGDPASLRGDDRRRHAPRLMTLPGIAARPRSAHEEFGADLRFPPVSESPGVARRRETPGAHALARREVFAQ